MSTSNSITNTNKPWMQTTMPITNNNGIGSLINFEKINSFPNFNSQNNYTNWSTPPINFTPSFTPTTTGFGSGNPSFGWGGITPNFGSLTGFGSTDWSSTINFTPSFTPTTTGFGSGNFSSGWGGLTLNSGFGSTDWSSTNLGGSSSSSSSSSTGNITSIEDYKKERARENAAKLEAVKDLNTVKEQKDTVKTELKKIEEGIQEDGSAVVVKEFKELSTWDKIKIGGMNALKGIGNVCKSIVGIEADGSFNLGKCIRNVAIAVGTAAVCIFAAPVVAAAATALGASAAAAATAATVAGGIVTATSYATLGCGLIKAGKGVVDACNATTTEEFDKATQEIGQAGFMVLASRAGIKGSAKAAGFASRATKPASTAPSIGGKILGGLKYARNVACTDIKNVIINPWKAIRKQGVVAGHSAKNVAKNTKGSFIKRFKEARNGVKDININVSKDKYDECFKNTLDNIDDKIYKIESELQATSHLNTTSKILTYRQNHLKKLRQQLEDCHYNPKHKTWKELRKSSQENVKETGKLRGKWYSRWFKKDKEITINNNQTIRRSEASELLKQVKAEEKALASQIQQLTKLRMESMSKMAKHSSYKTEVEKFGFSTKWYSRPLNWGKSKLDSGMTKTEWVMGTLNVGAMVVEPWWALQPLVRQNALMPVNLLTLFYDPVLDKPEGEMISAEEVNKKIQECNTALAQCENLEKQLNSKLKLN